MTPRRIAILGCSGLSTGEFAIALEWRKQCRRPLDAFAITPIELAPIAEHHGLPAVTYRTTGGAAAVADIRDHLAAIRPDVLLIADLLLFCGYAPELGHGLEPLLDQLPPGCAAIGLDLYDWEARGGDIDVEGQLRHAPPTVLPATLGRLVPSPYLPPAASTAGRGRYRMVARDAANIDAIRQRRSSGHGRDVVVAMTTSPWQHAREHAATRRAVEHLPAVVAELVATAAPGRLTVNHLGPEPFEIPDGRSFQYRHHTPSPRAFWQMLKSADLFLTMNPIAFSAVRSASLGLPVVWVSAGGPVADGWFDQSAAGLALMTRAVRASPPYPMAIWPVGMHRFIDSLLRHNPFASTHAHVDLADADAPGRLGRLLGDGRLRDDLSARQLAYFDSVSTIVDGADEALDAALTQG